jgi:hypothetical protein
MSGFGNGFETEPYGTSEENCVQLEARRGAVLEFADQATPDQE